MSTFEPRIRKFGTAPVFFTAISTIHKAPSCFCVLGLRWAMGLAWHIRHHRDRQCGDDPHGDTIAEIRHQPEGGRRRGVLHHFPFLRAGDRFHDRYTLFLSHTISVAFISLPSQKPSPCCSNGTVQFQLPPWLCLAAGAKQTVGIPALIALTAIMLTKGLTWGQSLVHCSGHAGIGAAGFFHLPDGVQPATHCPLYHHLRCADASGRSVRSSSQLS